MGCSWLAQGRRHRPCGKKAVPRWAIQLAQDTRAATRHSNLDGQRSVRYPRNHLRSSTFLPNLVVQGRDRCHGIISASAGGSLLPDDGSSQEFATMEEVREEAVEGARQLLSNAVLTGNAGSSNNKLSSWTRPMHSF